jgi:hypothetical protein
LLWIHSPLPLGTKIGHKGSGMKFALALIHRLGSQLIVRVGPHDLKSVSVAEAIRGQEHQIIRPPFKLNVPLLTLTVPVLMKGSVMKPDWPEPETLMVPAL